MRSIAERADLTGLLDPHPAAASDANTTQQHPAARPAGLLAAHRPAGAPDRRGLRRSPEAFGNPFATGRHDDRATVIARYEQWLHAPKQNGLRERAVRELRGRDLVRWCAPQACHADVLLKFVNTTKVTP